MGEGVNDTFGLEEELPKEPVEKDGPEQGDRNGCP
jgi:hypothetical protein